MSGKGQQFTGNLFKYKCTISGDGRDTKWIFCKVPEDRMVANVVPLFKKGCKEKSGNYRFVSLTLVLGELLEELRCQVEVAQDISETSSGILRTVLVALLWKDIIKLERMQKRFTRIRRKGHQIRNSNFDIFFTDAARSAELFQQLLRIAR
eukprot:g46011.t1